MLELLLLVLPILDTRPPVEDLQRFPAIIAYEQMRACEEYKYHLKRRMEFELCNQAALNLAYNDAEYCWWSWQMLWQAGKSQCITEIRRHLDNLREWIGEESYYRGRMPPCVPLWRCTWKN